jgi:HPt (histidine-containing phosphotransfer) domain-containing protein
MPADTIPIIDAVKLSRAANGDAALQVEMLALFTAEVERLMRQVEDAPDPQTRNDRLRALVAVARNTGASMLAQEARELETQIAEEAPNLEPLRQAVAQTLAFVRRAGT